MTFTLRCATPSLRTFERDSTHSLCKWLEREALINLPCYTWAGKTLYRKQPRKGKKEAKPEKNNKIRSVVTLIQVSLHNEANSAKSNNMVEWLGRLTWNLTIHSLSLALTISWICFRQSLVQLLSSTQLVHFLVCLTEISRQAVVVLLRVDQTTLKLSHLLFTNILSPVYSPGVQVVSWGVCRILSILFEGWWMYVLRNRSNTYC